MARERAEARDETREETGRRRRVPLGGAQLKLAAEKREGYVRRFFNDKGGRLQAAEAAGYAHVLNEKGEKERRLVGTAEGGGPMYAYLMEQRAEFYAEDQAAKQGTVDQIDHAIKGGAPRGANANPADFYTPKGLAPSMKTEVG